MFNDQKRTPVDAIREDQMQVGRTLSVKPGYRSDRDTGSVHRPVAKKPFIAKGHDAILKNLQDSGSMVKIYLVGGDDLIGKVMNRDKFTITVELDNGDRATIYKHAIEYFVPVRVQ